MGWAQNKLEANSGELGVGTVELLRLFFFFSSQKGFFVFLKPVKNVPAP